MCDDYLLHCGRFATMDFCMLENVRRSQIVQYCDGKCATVSKNPIELWKMCNGHRTKSTTVFLFVGKCATVANSPLLLFAIVKNCDVFSNTSQFNCDVLENTSQFQCQSLDFIWKLLTWLKFWNGLDIFLADWVTFDKKNWLALKFLSIFSESSNVYTGTPYSGWRQCEPLVSTQTPCISLTRGYLSWLV